MRFAHRFSYFNGKRNFVILGICWLATNLILFSTFGIELRFESVKYLQQADLLLSSGNFSSANFIFYSIPILLIAISKSTGSFPWLVLLVQLAVNALSIYYFYRLQLSFSKNHFVSLLFTLLLQCMFYYQLYNVYLFTESLYFSFSILYTYTLFSIKKISVRNLVLLFFSLSLLYFTRPTGVFFLPATIFYIIFRFIGRKAMVTALVTGVTGLLLLYLLLNLALPSGGEFDFLLPYLDERVICGVPTVTTPNPITIPGEKNSVEGLWYLITHHTELFVSLALKRLWAFFGVIRPYYSMGHNVFIAAYFWVSYIAILTGIRKLCKLFLPQTIYFICIILFIMVTVMISCDEWHNRFILALLPFFLLLASAACCGKPEKPVVHVQQ